MPRSITAQSLEKLGNDPVIIMQVYWHPDNHSWFADRTINEQVSGRILSLGNLDQVLRSDNQSAISTVSVTLDDTDGILRAIYDNYNIHKQVVRIYQWFIGLQFDQKFLLFEGLINSPIEWSDKDRTLKFEIISKVEDIEIGFSIEQGMFPDIPVHLIGKMWPLCFGTPRMVPAMALQEAPTASLVDYFGIPDPAILWQIARLEFEVYQVMSEPPAPQEDIPEDATLEERNEISQRNFEARMARQLSIETRTAQLNEQIEHLTETYKDQRRYLKTNVTVTMDKFPEGTYVVRIGSATFKATFTRLSPQLGNMHINMQVPSIEEIYDQQLGVQDSPPNSYIEYIKYFFGLLPPDKEYEFPERSEAARTGFQFFNIGTTINILNEYPIAHVVNSIPSTVLGVYAFRSYGGIKTLTPVPPEYYDVTVDEIPASVTQVKYDGQGSYLLNRYNRWLLRNVTTISNNLQFTFEESWLKPTYVTLKRPLKTASLVRNEQRAAIDQIINKEKPQSRIAVTEEWDDEIYVVLQSSIGPNVVDIIRWVIETFTDYNIDETSFTHVKDRVANYPANFMLVTQQNILQFLNEVAYQSRCSIVLVGDTFFLTYLPEDPIIIDTITQSDIEANSLILSTTETEDLVTKYTASFKQNYLDRTEDSLVVLRYNIHRYGLHEETRNFYIYDNHYAVKKSTSFWLLRRSNTWKKISFNCFLNKLNLETGDAVTIDLGITDEPVRGLIESAVYNASNNSIEMTVLLNVRAGEMTGYDWFWPADLDEQLIFPDVEQFEAVGGTSQIIHYSGQIPTPRTQEHSTYTEPQSIGNNFNITNLFSEQQYIDAAERLETLIGMFQDTEEETIQANYIEPYALAQPIFAPSYTYSLEMPQLAPFEAPTFAESLTNIWPGEVVSGSGEQYVVKIFKSGLETEGVEVEAKQLQIESSATIPPKTSVLVGELTRKAGGKDYYIQVPVWLVQP